MLPRRLILWNGSAFADLASVQNSLNGSSSYIRPPQCASRLIVESLLPSLFPMAHNQGCPISPLLYALAVEPLAIALRTHPDVKGLCRGRMSEVISLYADDMLLYLTDASPSVQAVLLFIKHFGAFSGLQINCAKSQILRSTWAPPQLNKPHFS